MENDHAVSSVLLVGAARPPLAAPSRRKTKPKPKPKPKKKSTTLVLAPHANSTERVQSKLYNLTLDVNNLHQQIASLTTYRSILYARALVTQYDHDGSILRKAAQYFGVFRRGYRAADRRPASLIHAIADEDLSLGTTGFGRDMLLEQWRRYTRYFGMRRCDVPAPQILPGRLEEEDDQDDDGEGEGDATTTVRAALTFQGSFTPTALAVVFPAVLQDPELTQHLLGKSFSADAVFHLHFHKKSGLLVRHDVDTDFFSVLANALGNAKRAAEIMQVVGVAEESMLADPVEDDSQDQGQDHARPVQLEPLERVVHSKRSRVTVVTDDDDSEDRGRETQAERVAPAELVTEPDAEPVVAVDTRHTLAFVLS